MLDKILDEKYRLIRKIGAGGMGSVFEAERVESGERFAIKVITPTETAKDSTLIRRFHREARAATAIDSPHIGRVVDTGTCPVDGVPYMVMELLEGEDMSEVFKRVGMLSADVTLRIAAQVLLGLEKAHAAGIVHRDIKPANIYLSRHESPDGGSPLVLAKVLDFGVAKMVRDQAISTETGGLTRTGSMIGSPLYMSPEQARGSKVIDERADIWSLGIVLFEALTGRTPYHHIDALGELILAICSELPPVVQDYSPWVPKQVASVIHRSLSLDPSCRHQTARDFLEEVLQLLPNGYEIREDMLVQIDEQARSRIAPRLEISHASAAVSAGSTPSAARMDSAPNVASSPGNGAPRHVGRPKYDSTIRIDSDAGRQLGASSDAGQSPNGGTHQGVTHGVSPHGGDGPPMRSSRSLLLVAFAAALLVVAIGGYALFGPPSSAADPPHEAAAAPTPETSPAPISGDVDVAPTPEPAAPPEPTGAKLSPSAVASAETAPPPEAARAPGRLPTAPPPSNPGSKGPPASHATSGVDTEGFGDRK